MRRNKIIIIIILVALAGFAVFKLTHKGKKEESAISEVKPQIGNVEITISTTGIIEPQNRLEIKPSIGGRVEQILVKEGDRVKAGDILAWMSSTERAALIDAARSRGEEVLRYWEDAYKRAPLISPIDAEVIVRAVEPGQTVTATDAILVLSDRLVVNAQFDETDIGRVKIGQKALITLDAYPDVKLQGLVDHIAYESKIVNNVTIYEVDILPREIPEILRSGMSVTVEVVEKASSDVLTIPSGAIHYEGKRQYVLVKEPGGKIAQRDVKVGLNNDKQAEAISGLTAEDNIIIEESAYLPKKKESGTNPFMPSRRR